MNNENEKNRNELIKKIQNLPANQISRACHLFQIMVYSKGDQKGEILSQYLQTKAIEFLNSGLYKKEPSYQVMKNKIKKLEKENLCLKKNQAKSRSRIHSLSVQVSKAKCARRRQTSKIRAAI